MLRVHSYESMGTFDGPGLGSSFSSKAQLPRLYCANPDTIEACGGTPTEAAEILRMARDQKPFFGRRGGVTFSGGEPTFPGRRLIPLVRALRAEGIHVCLARTAGCGSHRRGLLGAGGPRLWLDVNRPSRNATGRSPGATTPPRCAPRRGSRSTTGPSGCATCSFRDTATPRRTSAPSESVSADTG